MSDTFQPYQTYKETGIEWLPRVPTHWEIAPGFAGYSTALRRNIGLTEDRVLSLSYGRIITKPEDKLRGLVPESFDTYQIIEADDIIVRSTDLQNDKVSLRVGQSNDRGIITSAYLRLIPTNRYLPSFAYWLMHTYDITKVLYFMGSGLRQNIDYADLKRFPILIPSLEEQRLISKYCMLIDQRVARLIRNKRRLIALLTEQKQAIIQQAVTRGLDSDVPLKPSGVEWLGDIPAHWEVRSVRSCVVDVIGGVWGNDPHPDDDLLHVRCARVADFDMRALRVRNPIPTIRAVTQREFERRSLQAGDLLLEKSGGGESQPVGRVVMFDGQDSTVCSNFVSRLRPLENIVPEFLLYIMDALQGSRLTAFSIKQTTGIQNLDQGHYLSNKIGLPDIREQRRISAMLNEKVNELRAIEDRTLREISLLQEYRTRLVADVITGQLDVRELAASLPDEDAEPDLDLDSLDSADWDGELDEAVDELIEDDLVEVVG